MEKTKSICKCGHKLKDHRVDLKECYVHKRIKGSIYQCVCYKFEEDASLEKGGKKSGK